MVQQPYVALLDQTFKGQPVAAVLFATGITSSGSSRSCPIQPIKELLAPLDLKIDHLHGGQGKGYRQFLKRLVAFSAEKGHTARSSAVCIN
jgi:hypothetical protein